MKCNRETRWMKAQFPITAAIVGVVLVAGFAFVVVKWLSYPTVTRAPNMTARLVDGMTGEPISDARVEVLNTIEPSFSMCGGECKALHSYHTITDRDGYFVVPAWGPETVPSGWTNDPLGPWVKFVKDGYSQGPGEEGFAGGRSDVRLSLMACLSGIAVTSSKWNHRQILLYRNGFYPQDQRSDFIPFDKTVGYIDYTPDP